MYCRQQGIACGLAEPHYDSVCREREVVSGPSGGADGEHGCHRVQHPDHERERSRRGPLCLLGSHQQETQILQSSPDRPR